MSKYLIEFTRLGTSAIVEYDEQGDLIFFKIDYALMDQAIREFILRHFPVNLASLNPYTSFKNVKVTEVPFDTSFEAFYDTYAYKFGNKQRCVKLWEVMNEEERIKAIKYIQQYNQWLIMNPGTQKKLPETYLYQKPWNN